MHVHPCGVVTGLVLSDTYRRFIYGLYAPVKGNGAGPTRPYTMILSEFLQIADIVFFFFFSPLSFPPAMGHLANAATVLPARNIVHISPKFHTMAWVGAVLCLQTRAAKVRGVLFLTWVDLLCILYQRNISGFGDSHSRDSNVQGLEQADSSTLLLKRLDPTHL